MLREFAITNGYPIEDMELIITGKQGAYQEIRKQIDLMSYDWVDLPGIGGLFLKVWTLKTEINKLNRVIAARDYKVRMEVHEVRDTFQAIYNRVTETFYESKEKKINKVVGSPTCYNYDYSYMEGHIFPNLKPGSKAYGLGCRCVVCKEKTSKYRSTWYKRKQVEELEEQERKQQEIEMYGPIIIEGETTDSLD